MRSRALPSLLLLSLVTAIAPLHPQAPVVAKKLTTPTCRACRLDVTKLLRVGGEGNALAEAGRTGYMLALADGTLAVSAYDLRQIWIITRDGKVLRRIGARGEGPGEFMNLGRLRQGAGDSLFVQDRTLARLSVFSSAGTFGHSFRTPPGMSEVLSMGGTRVVASGRSTGLTGGKNAPPPFPNLALASGDSVVRLFGDRIVSVDRDNPLPDEQILIPYHGFVMAIARGGHYTIDCWDPTGRARIFQLIREPEWFPRSDAVYDGPSPDRPTSPRILDGWIDRQDRLWVLSYHPGERWKEALGRPIGGEGGTRVYPVVKPDVYFQGVVEVFDLQRQTLLFSGTLPYYAYLALGQGLVAARRTTADGDDYIQLLQLALKGAP